MYKQKKQGNDKSYCTSIAINARKLAESLERRERFTYRDRWKCGESAKELVIKRKRENGLYFLHSPERELSYRVGLYVFLPFSFRI